MKKYLNCLILTLTILLIYNVKGFSFNEFMCTPDTYIYSIKGTDTLKMDLYKSKGLEPSPCVIFLFGGGFFTGNRNANIYKKYFNFLVENGFTVASIDYRLGLKEFVSNISDTINNKKAKFKPVKFVKQLMSSINIAVEDLYSATTYLINNHEKFNINKEKIIISGSSAGAITVLQGEYYLTNFRTLDLTKKLSKKEEIYKIASQLPNNFKYSGVIAFAGAIASIHGKIKWLDKPCPIQLFHGNSDSNVPYHTMKTPFGSFYGSEYIVNELIKIKSPYYFVTEDNQTHSIAVTPMENRLTEILNFLNVWVIEEKPYFERVVYGFTNQVERKKKFKLKDYIKSNFVRAN